MGRSIPKTRGGARATVEKLHLERLSQRAIARTTGLSRITVAAILKKRTPLAQTIRPLPERPILELDELWSFVARKGKPVWSWIALEQQTRRIVGVAFGDRSTRTVRKLGYSLPPDYRKRAVCSSDFWEPDTKVLPSKRHRPVGKETGETAHVARFNNTLRQRCANLVRRTLSCSKDDHWHEVRIRLLSTTTIANSNEPFVFHQFRRDHYPANRAWRHRSHSARRPETDRQMIVAELKKLGRD